MHTPLLGIVMILASFGFVCLGAIVVVQARLRHQAVPVRPLTIGGGAWLAVYALALGASSLTSHEQLLAVNHEKQFCGFYLDCHLQMAVSRVDTGRVLGSAATPRKATGVFYVVTLRVSSTARAAHMHLLDPQIVIRDAQGHAYGRSADAEAALAAAGAPAESLSKDLGPGESFLTTVAFDLPADAPAPRLAVTEGIWADKLIELFLIGDEDSFLHKRTAFALRT